MNDDILRFASAFFLLLGLFLLPGFIVDSTFQ